MGRYIKILFCGLLLLSVYSCNKKDDFTESIFVDEPKLNPGSKTYQFDMWLNANYLKPYNLEFRYKLPDVYTDIDYNLVPASIDKSMIVAVLTKYLWFDVYSKIVSEDFLKQYGPRIIKLIGSPAYNPSLGTMILGTAEGGIEVTLYRCNEASSGNIDFMNENYFKTMHHEFAHILQQQKTQPKEFETLSAGQYDPTGWQNRTAAQAAALGYVSPYAGSEPREDFVEVIANYIVKSDAQWQAILNMAAQPGPLPMRGDAIIKAKLELVRKWLADAWKIDLDAMHKEVQDRQNYVDDALQQGLTEINAIN